MLLVIGYWLFVIGYWLLVIGYWLLVIGYWLLVIGYWLLVIGYWLLVICYWLFVICYWLFVICYWLFVIGYWLFVLETNNQFPMPDARCPAQACLPYALCPMPYAQSKKNRLAIFHSAYLNQYFNGSPQRRLTSAFDLVSYQVGTVGSDLKFLGTSPVYCCPNILIP